MSARYQFTSRHPGRVLAAVTVVAIAYFGLPSWLLNIAPAREESLLRNVDVAPEDSDLNGMFEGLDGMPYKCEVSDMPVLGDQYNCPAATIDSITTDDVEDPQRTMRRMIRATYNLLELPDAPARRLGEDYLMVDEGTLGMLVHDEDEDYVYVQVRDIASKEGIDVAEKLWTALTESALPAEIRAEITEEALS